ncbi:MAG: M50 family metallopeptidase [Rikenellaceae bacterium]
MKFISYLLILIALTLSIIEFIPTITWGYSHLSTYYWMLYGMGGYFLMHLILFRRNIKWMQTFAHELSHTLVSLMFLRKIHSFHVEEGTGAIVHSGRRRFGDIFISLAPYCLPYFTFLFIFLRIVGASNMLYIFDLLIGFSFAFHLSCFWRQTGSYQTDIQQHGLIRSYLFIAAALIFNTTIILLSIRLGIVKAVCYLMPQYWHEILKAWDMILSLTK